MSIASFAFDSPTRILYGSGMLTNLNDEIGGFSAKRVLIVTDKGIAQCGLLEKVEKILKAKSISYIVFDDVEPNPKDITVEKGAKIAEEENIDLIIGLGGGSSMDCAKGIGLLATNGGKIADYWGIDTVAKPALPLITIPTTAGTGSEVTFWAVIDDTTKTPPVKESVGSRLICPSLAIVDPELTFGLPPALTASTGMDALTHAIEAYTSTLANPFSDALSLYSIKLISENLRKAYANGQNKAARNHMMIGSLMAGVAFFNSDIAGVHCMAEAIGGLYDTPHGISCAIFLPYVMEYSLIGNMEKYAEIARAMGEDTSGLSTRDSALKAVEAVKKLMVDIDTPSPLEIGIKPHDIQQLSQISVKNVSAASNPRQLSVKDFETIFNNSMA